MDTPKPSQPHHESKPIAQSLPFTAKTLVLFTALALIFGSIIAVIVLKTPPPTRARVIGARLDLVSGDVAVTDQGSTSKELSGTPLAVGAHIATGKGARAMVRTADGAAVFLRDNTEIVLADKGFDLSNGEVWLDAPKVDGDAIACNIGKTSVSSSDAGLSIKRSTDDVTVYVARGLAIVTSPAGRAEVNAGEQALVKGGASPQLSPVAFWQDWTGGMGDEGGARGAIGSGVGRLYGLDPNASAGAAAQKLGIAKQVVRAVVRDGVAETEVDQTFSNPNSQAIEGWYWFTVPTAATISSFALETNGVLVEGEVVERHEAAARYQAMVQQAFDPALLEWIDGRTYRARIFPVPAGGTRRVVVRYTELLPTVDGKIRYVYPLRSEDPVRFDEFALSVDLGAAGSTMTVATSIDAVVEDGGAKVTMRRSGFVPRADFQLEMTSRLKTKPLRAWRFQAGADQADYVMLRYVPEVDFSALPPQKADLVLVVDTSAGGDDGARQLRTAAAEAILRALSDDDHFALVALDVTPTVIYPKDGLAPASDSEISKALEKLSDHSVGGATDLGAMFEPGLERLHGTDQPAIVYVGDGVATSGETTADELSDRMRRSLAGSRARFFTVGVGGDARQELLAQLSRTGGGEHLRIDDAEQTTEVALRLASAIKTPTITDLNVDLGAGLDQPFESSTGKLSRGEEYVLLARTHHALPPNVKISGRIGGKDASWSYPVSVENDVVTSLVPRLWASEYVRRLIGSGSDENRSKILSLGLEYGLLTPHSSILALESDAAYAAQGIPRRNSPVRGVRLTSIENSAQEKMLIDRFGIAAPAAMAGCDNKVEKAGTQGTANLESTPSDQFSTKTPMQNAMAGSDMPVAPAATVTAMAPRGAASAAAFGMQTTPPVEAQEAIADANGSNMVAGGGGVGPGAAHVMRKTSNRPAMVAGKEDDARDRQGLKAALDKSKKDVAAAALSSSDPSTAINRKMRIALSRCSDAASRPLAERIVLWSQRLKPLTQASDVMAQFNSARASCELPDWRDEAALLDLVEKKITTEDGATLILSSFPGDPDGQSFVARKILQRTVDVRIAAAVERTLFGGVDWDEVDHDLADIKKPEDRLAHLRAAMLQAPGDPQGDVRLVKMLVDTGARDEAIAHGRRLRDRGLLTPTLAQELGDVLADAGETDEALRTYSEVVEFDPNDPAARRVLGDIYLRRGWYDAAYRQYKTLIDIDGRDPLAHLRLASAAAGAGRVDEALRIERDVAGGEGNPGPDDPRVFARLASATRLGALFAAPTPNSTPATQDAIARKLKELGLFSGPGTLAIVTWEDRDAHLYIGATDDKNDALAGETTDAGAVGLYSVLSANDAFAKVSHAVRWKSDPPGRSVRFHLSLISWDGKAFHVAIKDGSIDATAKTAPI
jgi:tetratricopeptide (TPR) repeat protein